MVVLLPLLGGCGRRVDPPGSVRGVILVDEGTQYVLRDTPSEIGGACDGWYVVAIERPGDPDGTMDNLLCWRESGGSILISNRQVEAAVRFPVASVIREGSSENPDPRLYLPPFR